MLDSVFLEKLASHIVIRFMRKRMMRVLQINSVCGTGSTGRIATDIDSKLKENDIEGFIAYGRETSIHNEHILRIGNKIDYHIHGGLTRIFDTHALLGSRGATTRFIKQIENINPDLIHLHNLHGYYINIEILFEYLRQTNKPVIWTLHDCWSFTGHCAHFSYAQCEKWIDGCDNCPQKKSYPASYFVDNSQRNYDIKKALFTSFNNVIIVTPSQWLADLVGKSFLSKYTIKIIHNGVDTDIFKPVNVEPVRKKYKLGNKFVILGVANNWDNRKGLRYFIELSRIIDDDYIIVLVGLDEKQVRKLPTKIVGIKRTSNISELAQIYSVADVFINPSIEETFGMVTAESLACGTPAIVFDSTPGVEIVVDGCGYIARIGNIHDVKKYLYVVRNNGKGYYSKNCVKRVKDNFEKNDRFNEYIQLYEDTIKII